MTETQQNLIHSEAVVSVRQKIIDVLRSPEGRDRILQKWKGDVTAFEAIISEIEEMRL